MALVRKPKEHVGDFLGLEVWLHSNLPLADSKQFEFIAEQFKKMWHERENKHEDR